jgi:hypothetical protein
MKNLFLLFFLSLFLLTFGTVNAQYQAPIDGVTISNSPERPAPNETVTVTIESYLIDLNSSSVIWLVDGKEVTRGIGVKKITTKAPNVGKRITVLAVIGANNGKEVRKSVTLKSGSVDIIWETSRAYATPFYKGKNPFVYENWIKLIAIPHLSSDGIKEVDPKNLVYRWKMGGKDIENGTGYGVQSIEIKASEIPKPLDISVTVYTRDQREEADGFIRLEPVEPALSFYEISPLYGILLNKSLTNIHTLNNAELNLMVAPFGFNFNSKNNKLSYLWSINNVDQQELTKNQSIILRPKGNVEGSSNINIEVRHENDILE